MLRHALTGIRDAWVAVFIDMDEDRTLDVMVQRTVNRVRAGQQNIISLLSVNTLTVASECYRRSAWASACRWLTLDCVLTKVSRLDRLDCVTVDPCTLVF